MRKKNKELFIIECNLIQLIKTVKKGDEHFSMGTHTQQLARTILYTLIFQFVQYFRIPKRVGVLCVFDIYRLDFPGIR